MDRELSVWLAQYGIDLTDGPVVSAARGTGDGPESAYATSPRPVSTTRAALERQIAGALRSCIDAHGPITKQGSSLGSAAKRVAGAAGAVLSPEPKQGEPSKASPVISEEASPEHTEEGTRS